MNSKSNTPVMINGEFVDPIAAGVSIWDTTLLRGDGVFDVIKVRNVEGKIMLVGLDLHLIRLYRCAKQIFYKIEQERDVLEEWIRQVAKLGGPGKIRILLTRGGTPDHFSDTSGQVAPKCVILIWHPKPQSEVVGTLLPLVFPWNLDKSETHSCIKWLSYGPNMLMVRMAEEKGFKSALLITEDGFILEGPTFAIGWIKNGEIFTPSVEEMRILPSTATAIVMTILQRMGFKINIGRYRLEDVLTADEVFECSTGVEFSPIGKIGEKIFCTDQVVSLKDIIQEGLVERENWIGHLSSPYDFPVCS